MFRPRRILAWVACLGAVVSPAPASRPDEVIVSVASSLSDVMAEIAGEYQRTTGVTVVVNAGGSNALARQIVNGAPADLFISADAAQMDVVEHAGLVEPGTRRDLLSNQLVIVVPKGGRAMRGPRDLVATEIRRIAMADPSAVPSGVYARGYLEQQGLWPGVKDRVVPTGTVRAALQAVASGNADAGIVFATDARTMPAVVVAYAIPREQTPGIVYPMALVHRARLSPAARAFHAHLTSPAARDIFVRAGFFVLGDRR